MHYYLYEIKNTVNGKIYVGVHKTKSLDDGYMGSGKVVSNAIRKYGIEHFTKTILETFDNPADMFAREKEVVNDEFLARADVYNLRRGGTGGFDYINKTGIAHKQAFTKEDVVKAVAVCRERFSSEDYSRRNKASHQVSKETKLQWNAAGRKATLAESAKEKRKETFRRNQHQQGENNSQAGTMWITNGLISKKIKRVDCIPDGWNKGRVIKK
jgi:hypothetical protein